MKNSVSSHIFSKLPLIIIIFGFIFRLSQYIFNRSLWLDEAYLAYYVLTKTYTDLTGAINGIYAPLPFLWLAKFSATILGIHEYSLRLLPLFAGLISLPLFYRFLLYFFKPKIASVALLLFALNDSLIYYSSDFKQYSLDVMIALVIYMTIFKYIKSSKNISTVIFTSIVISLSLWFSQPAVFVVAGTAATLLLSALVKKNLSDLKKGLIISISSLFSFSLYYFFFLRLSLSDQKLMTFWNTSFLPFPPRSATDLDFYMQAAYSIFNEHLLGLNFFYIGVIFFIGGCFILFRRNRFYFCLLLLPLLLTAMASMMRLYLFTDRFLLFLIPSLLITLNYAVDYLSNRKIHSIIKCLVLVILLYQPFITSFNFLLHPRVVEEIKPVLNYYEANYKPGDITYVYYGALPAFHYYRLQYNLTEIPYISGIESRNNPAAYPHDLAQLHGQRVWLIFSHNYSSSAVDEEGLFIGLLNPRGHLLDAYHSINASVYLFDLSK